MLPLVPAYLGYLSPRRQTRRRGGLTLDGVITRRLVYRGVLAIFVGLGAAATRIRRLLYNYSPLLVKIRSAVIVIFGLHTLAVGKVPRLTYDTRRQDHPRQEGDLPAAT